MTLALCINAEGLIGLLKTLSYDEGLIGLLKTLSYDEGMIGLLNRDGPPPDFSGIPDFYFFFYLRGKKKKPESGKLTIVFVWEKLAV